ncbi:hypothetical protein TSAR_004549, partial [Trichomalopsis sarcophagae]
MKLIVGKDKLREMTLTERANTSSIPQAVYKAVFNFRNTNESLGNSQTMEIKTGVWEIPRLWKLRKKNGSLGNCQTMEVKMEVWGIARLEKIKNRKSGQKSGKFPPARLQPENSRRLEQASSQTIFFYTGGLKIYEAILVILLN